jgi:hypothetical protein
MAWNYRMDFSFFLLRRVGGKKHLVANTEENVMIGTNCEGRSGTSEYLTKTRSELAA